MPIRIPSDLPARKALEGENIFIMTHERAFTQDIRPLEIALLNLMPTKVTTETQLSRLLGNTPLQVNLTLVQTESYKQTHTSEDHMLSFYTTFSQIKDCHFDGLVITGAPVEQLEYEEVEYWKELCEIMDWSQTHVHSTMHICWAAQAALYHYYGIPKVKLEEKLFGLFKHKIVYKNPILLRGFDDEFYVPHSRHTTIDINEVKAHKQIKILASSKEAGLYAAITKNGKQIFITGHSEYDKDTLKNEYLRDKNLGLDIKLPKNYFPNDDDKEEPIMNWRAHANLLFANWLNYFVYQTTPYELDKVGEK